MRFSYLTIGYSSYLESFYQRRPDLQRAPFAVQHAALLDDCFAWNGAWSAALPKSRYEVQEIVANALPMQLAWARENGYRIPAAQRIPAIALRQLEEWNPDVVLIDDPVTFTDKFIAQLRSQCPGIRMVLGFSGSPSYVLDGLRSYDVLLSPTRAMALNYQSLGCCTRYFPHAFNTNILRRIPERFPVEESVIFVGALVRATGYHLKREQLLEAIVQVLPMRIYSPQAKLDPLHDVLNTGARRALYFAMRCLCSCGLSPLTLGRIPLIGRASTWKRLPMRQINPVLQPHLLPPLFGDDFYTAQRKHAITLNIHGDVAGHEAGNMRLFEVTGVGGCLLTDAKSNLGEFFEIDREVVAFTSAAECIEKARWLLEHPAEREAIAQAGQKRTLQEHTFQQRATALDAIIQEFLKHRSGRSLATPAVGTVA